MRGGFILGLIGFVNICHGDYISESATGIADIAVKGLEKKGIGIYQIKQPVIDSVSAEKAGKELLKNEVEGVILFLGTWMECSVAMSVVREIEHLPMCLWGFPMFMENGKLSSTGSYVSFAMFKGTMDRVGYKYKAVLGLPDDACVLEEVRCFSIAASCAERLKRTRIGLVGYTSMSIYPGTFDHVFLRVKIGPEVEQIDSYSLINEAEKLDEAECYDVINYLEGIANIRDDVTKDDLFKVSKLYTALKKLTLKRNLKGINVKYEYDFLKNIKWLCVCLFPYYLNSVLFHPVKEICLIRFQW